jgi:hypothetical protein
MLQGVCPTSCLCVIAAPSCAEQDTQPCPYYSTAAMSSQSITFSGCAVK